jgi:hypothetical protein
MENRLLILLFLLVIISTILGTTVWGNKNQITSSPDVSPTETCTGDDVKVAYSSAGDPKNVYLFGGSISISGDTLAVGAYGAPQNETGVFDFSGVVYVYTDGTYTSPPIKVANPSTGPPLADYYFGYRISISGNTLAVGSYGANQDGTSGADSSGIVYVYTDGNYESAPIKVAVPATGAPVFDYLFGSAVSISGNALAVGAYGGAQDGTSGADNSGLVYVYTDGNYASTPTKAGNPSAGPPLLDYFFGYSVSISGNTLAVGAWGSTQSGIGLADNSGVVYVYTDGNYGSTPVKAANPSEGPPLGNYFFGDSVSISGDTLVVGARGANQDGVSLADDSGSVYVYINGAYETTPIKVANPSTGPPLGEYKFGFNVYISGDMLVVAAVGANQDGVSVADSSGIVYVYTDGNYESAPTRLPNVVSPPGGIYFFGIGISASGSKVAVGCSGQPAINTGTVSNQGGAYIYPCVGV